MVGQGVQSRTRPSLVPVGKVWCLEGMITSDFSPGQFLSSIANGECNCVPEMGVVNGSEKRRFSFMCSRASLSFSGVMSDASSTLAKFSGVGKECTTAGKGAKSKEAQSPREDNPVLIMCLDEEQLRNRIVQRSD